MSHGGWLRLSLKRSSLMQLEKNESPLAGKPKGFVRRCKRRLEQGTVAATEMLM
jgi:hypothetical protein